MSVATSDSVLMVSESICLATVMKDGTERMISSSMPGVTVVRVHGAAGAGAGAEGEVGVGKLGTVIENYSPYLLE